QPDAIRILWVDANLAEVVRSLVGRALASPRRAKVVGAVDPRARRRRFDYRVDDIGIALRDVEPDAAEITGRHSVGDSRPGVAAVGRSPQTAPGPAAREAELASAALIRRCDERSPVGRDDDVRRSAVGVDA